jgi:photosystem II stability/assembly factor-like uncharacterized protein
MYRQPYDMIKLQNITRHFLSLIIFLSFPAILALAQSGAPEPATGQADLPFAEQDEVIERLDWFFSQRGFAFDTLAAQDYYDILNDEMAKEQRKFFEPRKGNRLNTAIGNLSWSSIGPTGLEGLASLPNYGWGRVSGRVPSMAINPTDPDIVYIGAAAGGLWKTTNGGSSWTDLAPSLASLTYGAIAIDPNNSDVVYAGGGEIMYSTNPWLYNGNGMFKSTDAGATWTNITNGFGSQTQFGAIAVSPFNSDVVFATLGSGYWHLGNLANEGVWRSTDAGSTWNKVLDQADAFDVYARPDSAGYVFAGIGGGVAASGVYRSTDNGSTWTMTSTGLPTGTSIQRIQLAMSPSAPTTTYAIIYYGTGTYRTKLYKTTDGGSGWFQIAVNTYLSGNYGSGWTDQGWYDLCVGVHPTDPNIVMTGNLELFRSTNGSSMTVLRTNSTSAWYSPCHVDYHIIRFAPSNGSYVYCGSDGGMFKSTDAGVTWTSVNNGLATLQLYHIASHPTNANIVYGGAQDNGNFRTLDGGATPWGSVETGDGMYCAVDPGNPNVVYMSTQYGSHDKSTNGGATFSGMRSTNGGWLSPLIIHPMNSKTLFVTNRSVYKSTNSGSSWTTIASNPSSDYINSIAMSPVNPSRMIFAGNDAFSNSPQVKVSTDTGATWTDRTSAIGGTARYISRVVCHPSEPSTMFAVRSGFVSGQKIYKTTDLGVTWANVTGNLPNVPHNCMIVDPARPNEYYAANDLGVYHTTDGGTNWTREGQGMPFVPVMDLEIVDFGATRLLRAATHGRSVYQASIDPEPVMAKVKAFLQGPYNTTSGTMDAGLNSLGTLAASATSQPYNIAPWNYTGSEAVSPTFFASHTNIVDWVLVELRTGTGSGTVVGKRAGFLLANGSIVDTDGSSALAFPGLTSGYYYIVVRHRNHIPVMSAANVWLPKIASSGYNIDFTTAQTKAYGTTPMKEVVTGVFGLQAGDVNKDLLVRYNGAANDRSVIFASVGSLTGVLSGYYLEDANLDGYVKYNGTANDRQVIYNTVGTLTGVVSSQVP